MQNPTEAKELALYFIGKSKIEYSGKNIRINISLAKQLLENYSKEEIIKVIDHLVDVDESRPNSLGLIKFVIEDKLKELAQEEEKQKAIERYKALKVNKNFGGVALNECNRNQNKNIGTNSKSRVREGDYKYLFDESKRNS